MLCKVLDFKRASKEGRELWLFRIPPDLDVASLNKLEVPLSAGQSNLAVRPMCPPPRRITQWVAFSPRRGQKQLAAASQRHPPTQVRERSYDAHVVSAAQTEARQLFAVSRSPFTQTPARVLAAVPAGGGFLSEALIPNEPEAQFCSCPGTS